MTTPRSHTWQDIQERIISNISDRTWSPGELIPGEAALAEQFGCARTTVNRALRELATTGVIDRKRKAGTRVALQPTRSVTAKIPIIRTQIESQELVYNFAVLEISHIKPSSQIKKAMKIGSSCKSLHIRSVHYGDGLPYIYEDRWINTQTIREILKIDLSQISANEWLVQNVPFSKGAFIVEAGFPTKTVANALELTSQVPVLRSHRSTWLEHQSVTRVVLSYSPGYQMKFEI